MTFRRLFITCNVRTLARSFFARESLIEATTTKLELHPRETNPLSALHQQYYCSNKGPLAKRQLDLQCRTYFRATSKLPERIAPTHAIDKNIKAAKIRLIADDGTHRVVSLKEGLAEAKRRELNLVCVNKQTDPPACKIFDYGKIMFQKVKKKPEDVKKARAKDLKEVQISINISSGHLEMKYNNILRFLDKKHPVKIVALDGRFQDLRVNFLDTILKRLESDMYSTVTPIKAIGRRAHLVVEPKKTSPK